MPAPPLTGARAAAAAALAPQTDTDPVVHQNLVEQVVPPALMLEWNEPWFTRETIAGPVGLHVATLNVIAFASRAVPGPGVDDLEALVVYVNGRLAADTYSWNLTGASGPRRFPMGNVELLGVRLSFAIQVSIQ